MEYGSGGIEVKYCGGGKVKRHNGEREKVKYCYGRGKEEKHHNDDYKKEEFHGI